MHAHDSEAHAAVFHGGRFTAQDLVEALMSGGLTQDVLVALTKLRQITSAAKVGTTVDYVTSALEQGQSVVVFTAERATAEDISARVAKLVRDAERGAIWALHGGLSQDVREEMIRIFQRPEREPDCIVATYGALREGVTLTRASVVVLHDLSWRTDEVLQAEARVHRIGQSRGVQSIWSIAEESIDTIFARVLASKAAMQSEVLGADDASTALAETDLLRRVGTRTIEEEAERLLRAYR
jgi:SNF2 family DNA or RNA helicase